MKVKEESEKTRLKFNIQKTKIMVSDPLTSWQIDGGKKWKQWQTLFSWALKLLIMVTAAMKLKAVTNLYSILESRDITLLTKVHIVKAMVLLVVAYGCESWTIKKADH